MVKPSGNPSVVLALADNAVIFAEIVPAIQSMIIVGFAAVNAVLALAFV